MVVALPSKLPVDPVRAGDLMIRVVPGTGDVGHVSVLTSDDLLTVSALRAEGIAAESTRPGFYVTVIEGGAFPHTRVEPFARRVLDGRRRVPPNTLILRPYVEALEITDDLPDLDDREQSFAEDIWPKVLRKTCSHVVKRRMKFEFQTTNVVYRVRGKNRIKLPRKFGPPKSRWLTRGKTGAPARIDQEGSAIELQSEADGFVEFETSDWHHQLSELTTRVQEARDMTNELNDPKNFIRMDTKKDEKGNEILDAHHKTIPVRIVKFPWDVDHLRARSYDQRLKADESLEVEIEDDQWEARIQASESFELSQFQSYLEEHLQRYRDANDIVHVAAPEMITKAKKILADANTSSIPDKDLVNLLNFLLIIVQYVEAGQTNGVKDDLAKEAIWLMSRTNFASMYSELLSPSEKKLFETIVQTDGILKVMGPLWAGAHWGYTRMTPFFKDGFKYINARWRRKAFKDKPLTIYNWLQSIIKPFGKRGGEPADMLTLISGDSNAMGRYPVKTDKNNDEFHLVKFEARSTSGHNQFRPAKEWVKFVEEVFKEAEKKRSKLCSFLRL
jgi:hypothetical protein